MLIYNTVSKLQDRFATKVDGVMQVILFEGIEFITAKRNYSEIVRTKERKLLVHDPIKELERILPQNLFLRIHRSCIVHLLAITGFSHHYVYVGEKKLPLSLQHYPSLCERFIIADEHHEFNFDQEIKDMSADEYLKKKRRKS